MTSTWPQLARLPQTSVAKTKEAVEVLLKYDVDAVVNLTALQQQVEDWLLAFKESVQLLQEYGFEEGLDLRKLSQTLETLRSTPAAGPPPPKGMASKSEVTPEMKERQRERPTTWALPMRQWFQVLDDIEGSDLYSTLQGKQRGSVNMYDVDKHFVQPWTRGTGCGLSVLMTRDRAADATLMLSHAWGEDMAEMKLAVMESLQQRGWMEMLDEIQVWFCVFANYQPQDGAGPSIPEQLKLEPFRQVIESPTVRTGHGMCAIHTSKADLYTRLWCVHEVAEAREQKVSIFSAMSEQYAAPILERVRSLFEHGCNDEECSRGAGILCNSSAARCSRTEDEKKIIAMIHAQHRQGFAALDQSVEQFRLGQLAPLVASMCFLARLRNHSPHYRDQKLEVLQDTQKLLRHLQVLQKSGLQGVSCVSHAVEDENAEVRKTAMGTLASVAEALLKEAAAAEEVREVVTATILPPLLGKIEDNEDSIHREGAVHALGKVAVALLGSSEDGDAAAKEVREVVTAKMLPPLLGKIEDKDSWEVRYAAVLALGAVAEAFLRSSWRGEAAAKEVYEIVSTTLLPPLLRSVEPDSASVTPSCVSGSWNFKNSVSVCEAAVAALGTVAEAFLGSREQLHTQQGEGAAKVVITRILPPLLRKVEDKESLPVHQEAVGALRAVAVALLRSRVQGEAAAKEVDEVVTATILPALSGKIEGQVCPFFNQVCQAAIEALRAVAEALLSSSEQGESAAKEVREVVTATILPPLLAKVDYQESSSTFEDATIRNAAVGALRAVAVALLLSGSAQGKAAAKEIREFVRATILPPLLRIEHKDWSVIQSVVDSLVAVAEALLSSSERGDSDSGAANQVSEVVATQILHPLLGSIEDQKWPLREASARGLGRIAVALLSSSEKGDAGAAAIVTPLLRRIEDERGEVRHAAATALDEVAQALLRSSEEGESGAAKDVVTRTMLPALQRKVEDRDVNVSEAAKQALAALRTS